MSWILNVAWKLLNFGNVTTTFLKYFSYSPFDISETCLFEELFDERSLKDLGSYFIIRGAWFNDVLTYSNQSFEFLYGLYVPSNKSNVKFVFISVLKPGFLNIYIMSYFHILFRSISQNCQSIILYNSVDCFSSLFDNEYSSCMPENSLISAS